MSELRAAVLQLARASGKAPFFRARRTSLSPPDTRFAAAATVKAATGAQALHHSSSSSSSSITVQAPASHKISADGRGRHTARANSSPWVLNADLLVKNGGKATKLG